MPGDDIARRVPCSLTMVFKVKGSRDDLKNLVIKSDHISICNYDVTTVVFPSLLNVTNTNYNYFSFVVILCYYLSPSSTAVTIRHFSLSPFLTVLYHSLSQLLSHHPSLAFVDAQPRMLRYGIQQRAGKPACQHQHRHTNPLKQQECDGD